MNPPAGVTGALVTEAQTLCFYKSTICPPSLIPPVGCLNAPVTLAPASLAAGATCTIDVVFKPSATGIRSGSVSIFDGVSSQVLSLAGLGLATP